MKLYHGSRSVDIKQFNYRYSRSQLDFGKGIYFTTNFDRAKKWACSKSRKGAVYEIDVDLDSEHFNLAFLSKEDEDLYYLFYICRIGLEEIAMDFMDDFEKFDVIIGPVLCGKKNGNMKKYCKLAERFNEGEITFDQLYKKTRLHSEGFDQWCFKSIAALECINRSIKKKYLIEKNVIYTVKEENVG